MGAVSLDPRACFCARKQFPAAGVTCPLSFRGTGRGRRSYVVHAPGCVVAQAGNREEAEVGYWQHVDDLSSDDEVRGRSGCTRDIASSAIQPATAFFQCMSSRLRL